MYLLSLLFLLCSSVQCMHGAHRDESIGNKYRNNRKDGYGMNYEFVALRSTDLAQRVAERCKKELIIPEFRQFADGELNVKLHDHERFKGKTVVIVQSTGRQVNELTLGVAFLAQELKQAGAQKIIAVTPYFGYARQDQGSLPGTAGHALIVARLFEQAGIDELIAVELHDESIISYFTIPVTNVSVRNTIASTITEQVSSLDSVCLVAPDKGARDYVKSIADQIGVGTITFSKERFAADQTRIINCEIACHGATGIVIDDIISTGGTAINVCSALPQMGYGTIIGYFVHPVFAGNAFERMRSSCFHSLAVSNTLELAPEIKDSPFISVFDISEDIVSVLQKKLENS